MKDHPDTTSRACRGEVYLSKQKIRSKMEAIIIMAAIVAVRLIIGPDKFEAITSKYFDK